MKIFWKFLLIAAFSTCAVFAQNSASTFRNYIAEKDFEKAGEIAQNVLNENPNDYDLAVAVGDVYFELENYAKSLEAYTKARKINDNDNKIVAKISSALVGLKRPKEAVEDLQKVLNKDKKNVELLIALANAYLAGGDVKNAEMQITNARSIDSKNANVFLMLGKIYFEQNIWELARTNYEDALKIEPNNVPARQNLAEVYWKLAVSADDAGETALLNEYLNRSLEQCDILVKNNEKDANSWRLKGQIHFNANQNLEAAQSYNKFLELRPNNYKERWRLAELLAQNGVCETAIPHLNTVVNSNHEDITDSIRQVARLYLGSCYYREKNYPEAIKTFDEANKKTPLEANDLRLFALSYLLGNDTLNALTQFNRLFEVVPAENCEMMLRVGTAILKPLKKYDEMINVLNLRNKNCNDEYTAFSYYSIGTAYYELKNVEESITNLQKSIEIDSTNYWAYIYLGDVHCFQKNIAEGEKQFNLVVEKGKLDTAKFKNELNAAFQKLCGIKLEAKKYRDLEKTAKDWIATMPELNEFGNLYLAISYQGLGEQSNACRYYREVLKINKDNKNAKDNLKALGC